MDRTRRLGTEQTLAMCCRVPGLEPGVVCLPRFLYQPPMQCDCLDCESNEGSIPQKGKPQGDMARGSFSSTSRPVCPPKLSPFPHIIQHLYEATGRASGTRQADVPAVCR